MAGATGQKDCPRLQNEVLSVEIKPPDGGWGWFIVFGCALVNFTIGGLYRSSGLFFVEFGEKFGGTASEKAVISSLFSGISYAIAPIACILSQRFSCRLVVFIGGLLGCLGLLMASFATELTHLYFSFGIMSGVGVGFVYTPSTIIVGQYFEKRRAFANGICIAASSLGAVIAPPLFDVINEEYLIDGTCLLFSGIVLNGCIGAMLFKPLKPTTRKITPEIFILEGENGGLSDSVSKNKEEINDYNDINIPTTHLPVIPEINDKDTLDLLDNNKSSEQRDNNSLKGTLPKNLTINLHRYPSRTCSIRTNYSDNTIHLVTFKTRTSSVLSDESLHLMPFVPVKSLSVSNLRQLIDFSILKMPIFILFTLSLFIQSFGYLTYFLLLPPYAESLGLKKMQISMLVTIESVVEFFSRLAIGFISDFKIVNRKYMFITGLIGSGCSIICVSFMNTFEQLIAINVTIGILISSYVTMTPTLWVDFVGIQNLPSAWSLHMVFVGTGFIVGQSMAGILKDASGSFVLPLAVTGSEFILAGIVVFFERFVSKPKAVLESMIPDQTQKD